MSQISVEVPIFETWKTIKLGTGLSTASDFRNALKLIGVKIGDRTNDILDNPAFTVATCAAEVELVVASVAEIGFKKKTRCKDIYIRAQELGLDLCPPEVGPQLRLQYTDQLRREGLVIAMEPITDSRGYPNLFRVVRRGNGDYWLDYDEGDPDDVFEDYRQFVFLRRK